MRLRTKAAPKNLATPILGGATIAQVAAPGKKILFKIPTIPQKSSIYPQKNLNKYKIQYLVFIEIKLK
jgi:hypothetical protein